MKEYGERQLFTQIYKTYNLMKNQKPKKFLVVHFKIKKIYILYIYIYIYTFIYIYRCVCVFVYIYIHTHTHTHTHICTYM